MWEHIYNAMDSTDDEPHRECKRCGAKQVKLQGKWKNGSKTQD